MGGIFCSNHYCRTDSNVWEVKDVSDYLAYQNSGRIIGKGSYGAVFKAIITTHPKHKNNYNNRPERHNTVHPPKKARNVAVKMINIPKKVFRSDVLADALHEISILKRIQNSPGLLNFKFALREQYCLLLITDFYGGGELWDHMRKFNDLKDCAIVIRQIVEAVAYLHQKNIAHLDIKPENVVFETLSFTNNHMRTRLIDFGCSKLTHDEEISNPLEYNDFGGTLVYAAPELHTDSPSITGDLLKKCDMWSIGVLTYFLTTKHHPFWRSSTESDVLISKRIRKADFDIERVRKLSNPLGDFIAALIQKDPSKRPSAMEALGHYWLSNSTNTL